MSDSETIPGGFYYVNGVAVNAEGVAIKNAPPEPPSVNVTADSVRAPSLAQEIAQGIAQALKGNVTPAAPARPPVPPKAPAKAEDK